MKKTTFVLSALFSLPMALSHADVKLPAIISDHMVLEKTAKVPVWGKADPGEEVTITLDGQTVKATAGADGKWKAILDLSKSGQGPFEMTVQGKNSIKISDVVVGEVWVASGQSNMEWTLTNTDDAQNEIAKSANPLLRQFAVKKATSAVPLDECEGRWVSASPETAGGFTAVGYYFGKALQNELKVPVGLIHTSWGGTPSEAWTSSPSLDIVPDLKAGKEKVYKLIQEQPEALKNWVTVFGEWLKTNNREDKPATDVAKYAAPDASTEGWQKVSLPGNVTAGKVSGNGVIWLRTEIERAEPSKDNLGFELGAIEGFDSIYWNGELLTALDYRNFPGTGYVRRWGKYSVPADKVKTGKNTLAIRIYAPAGPAKFPAAPKAAGKPITGEWLATEEVSFPALTSEQTASLPKAPQVLPTPQNVACQLFNGMVNPVIPYAISGAIWYQGESNAGRSHQYRSAFPLMIADWRKAWDQGDFPFYFCQLANYQDKKAAPGESGWAELREAQCMTLELPNTGQAILIDIGESGDIHPRNKKDVGLRLSLIALAKDYGKKTPYSGPMYDEVKFEGGKARVSFKQTDGGLVAKAVPETYSVVSKENKTAPTVRNSPKSELEGFAICGEDRKWVWADAKIDGNDVVVWSEQVSNPIAVRYAWSENPTVNLYNGAGLPACPFRTDSFPAATLNAKYGN
jgi:sialate O-acetylesterase